MSTYDELLAEKTKLEELSQNYYDQNWCVYAAMADHLDAFLCDKDEDTDEDELIYDETGYESWLEEELPHHLPLIYSDWVKGEYALAGDGKGGFQNDTSGYLWLLWALHPNTLDAFTYVYEYAVENDLDIPEWYTEFLD